MSNCNKERKGRAIALTQEVRKALEKGFNTKDAPDLSARCYIILLKAEGTKISEISKAVGIGCQKVSYWIKRFREDGIDGLNDVPKESVIKHDYLRGGYLHYFKVA